MVYLQQNQIDENLTKEELTKIVTENVPEFKLILGRMSKYNSNITGSNSYFYKKRGELEALMEQEDLPTIWFTLSAADNHWYDPHKLTY